MFNLLVILYIIKFYAQNNIFNWLISKWVENWYSGSYDKRKKNQNV